MNEITNDKWYEKEFATLDFGDKRLDKRFLKIGGYWGRKSDPPPSIIDCVIARLDKITRSFRNYERNEGNVKLKMWVLDSNHSSCTSEFR